MNFGLICEGPTDQVTLENMLCGIYNDEDLCELITELQPGGVSDTNSDGGWERVLEYIASYKFREAFDFIKNIVIHVDTDIVHMKGFDVDLIDENGKTLKSPVDIISKVKDKLISQIDLGQKCFYNTYKTRIIFAITVHSTEIWLFKHYNQEPNKAKVIHSGETKLAEELQKHNKLKTLTKREKGKRLIMDKKYDNYDQLSRPFFNKKTSQKNIDKLYKRDESFKVFKDSLPQL